VDKGAGLQRSAGYDGMCQRRRNICGSDLCPGSARCSGSADRSAYVRPAGLGRWPQLCDRMVSSYHLRQDQAAIGFVRDLVSSGCPVGVICHGPSTLVGAEVAVRALARAQALARAGGVVRALALARGRGVVRALARARARGGVRVLVRVRLVRVRVLVRVRAGTGVRAGRG
jgi:hypothetical protein